MIFFLSESKQQFKRKIKIARELGEKYRHTQLDPQLETLRRWNGKLLKASRFLDIFQNRVYQEVWNELEILIH